MDLVLGLAELLLFPTLLMLLVIAAITAERTLAPPAAPLPEDRRAVICSGAELARGVPSEKAAGGITGSTTGVAPDSGILFWILAAPLAAAALVRARRRHRPAR